MQGRGTDEASVSVIILPAFGDSCAAIFGVAIGYTPVRSVTDESVLKSKSPSMPQATAQRGP
jgi:dolichol kinase